MRGVLTAVALTLALLLGAGAAQADTTAPELLGGTIRGATVKLYFSEPMKTSVTLTLSGFTVTASSTTVGNVSNPTFDTTETNILTLTLDTATNKTETADIDIDTTAGLEDAAGNGLAAVEDFSLTNINTDHTPTNPALIGGGQTVNGATLTLTYDQKLLPRFPPTSDFSVTVSPTPSPAVTVSSLAINPDTPEAGKSTVVLTLSAAVLSTDTVTVTSYATATDPPNLQNEWGVWATTFTNQTLINNTSAHTARITGGNAITEGEDATFTVTVSPTPTDNVTVDLTIAQTGGDFVAASNLGTQSVTVGTGGTATYRVTTVDDPTDEPDGTVTAEVIAGTGYTRHASQHTASVSVNDNDATSCSATDTAVSWATGVKTDLAQDCTTLLGLKDTLRGIAPLNWSRTTQMNQWDGLTAPGSIAGTQPRVRVLRLRKKQLSGTIPPALGDLAGLTSLYLDDNRLSGTIPAELGDLTNLQVLRLQENELRGEIPAGIDTTGGANTPTGLARLTNLTSLQLYNNQLGGPIPAALGRLTNLQVLRLHDNQLSDAIPPALGNLANLRWLFLENNQPQRADPCRDGCGWYEQSDRLGQTHRPDTSLSQQQPTQRRDPPGLGQPDQPDKPRSPQQPTQRRDPPGLGQPDQPDKPQSPQQPTRRGDPPGLGQLG